MVKLILVICSLIAACAASEDIFYSQRYVPEPIHTPSATLFNGSYFPPLDHFRPQDARTVEFHYRLNLDHYVEGGPIFVFIHSGDFITTEYIETGLVVDVAAQVGGAVATTEHRYFGLNRPTDTISFEDLAFLTVEQAVADIAVFVSTLYDHLGKDPSETTVILYGTGYGATLATYARRKYPHLVSGVFASSGLYRGLVFDTSYHDNLSANINIHGGANCFARVHNAFDVLNYLFENNAGEYLQERLRLCDVVNPQNTQEVAFLFELFIDLISNYIRRYRLFGLENFCRDMNYYEGDTFNSLIRWAVYAYGNPNGDCIHTNYNELIGLLTETNWDAQTFPQQRAFGYLRCTQFAAFRITSDYEQTAFPSLLDAEYHYKFCEDVFGAQYNRDLLERAVSNLNNNFGGQDQTSPNIIFTNAGLDPWIGHGVADFDLETSSVIYLYYSTAGADLTSIALDEPFELTRAKEQITETLVRWTQRPIPAQR